MASVVDVLSSLVDRSLVLAEEHEGRTRYRMLETVHAYASEQLDATGARADLTERHLNHFVDLAERAGPELTGPRQETWMRLLEVDQANIAASLEGPHASDGRGLSLVAAVWQFWLKQGHLTRGRQYLGTALNSRAGRPMARARALHGAGALAYEQNDVGAHRAANEEALRISRQIGDSLGMAKSLNNLGTSAYGRRDFRDALVNYEEALQLFQAVGDRAGTAAALHNLGNLAWMQGRYDDARGHYERSLALRRDAEDGAGMASSLCNLGLIAHSQGDYVAARDYLEESLVLARRLDRGTVVTALLNLGSTAHAQGDGRAAQSSLEEGLAIARDLGNPLVIATFLERLGNLAFEEGDEEATKRRYAEALRLFGAVEDHGSLADIFKRFAAIHGQKHPPVSARLSGKTSALLDALGSSPSAEWQAQLAATNARARAALGEKEWDIAFEEGRQMSLDDAIALAVGET